MALTDKQRAAIIDLAHKNAQAKLAAQQEAESEPAKHDPEKVAKMFELRQRLETKQTPRHIQERAPTKPAEDSAHRSPWVTPASVIACAMLLLAAFATLPYGYYQIMRWIVCAAMLLLAYQMHKLNKTLAVGVLVVLVFVYNPIAPTHLSRQTWSWLNLGTVAALASTLFIIRRDVRHEKGDNAR